MKRVFKMTLKIKGTNKVFAKGFEPGVVAAQLVEYKDAPLDDCPGHGMLLKAVFEAQDLFIKENIEVVTKEVSPYISKEGFTSEK